MRTLLTLVFAVFSLLLIGCEVTEQYPAPASTITHGDAINVTDATFGDVVAQSSQPVLIDFWAPWCGPCRELGPAIESVATMYKGRVVVGKVNVDEATNVASEFGISSIPTVMIFKNGEAVHRMKGVRSESEIVALLDDLLR